MKGFCITVLKPISYFSPMRVLARVEKTHGTRQNYRRAIFFRKVRDDRTFVPSGRQSQNGEISSYIKTSFQPGYKRVRSTKGVLSHALGSSFNELLGTGSYLRAPL